MTKLHLLAVFGAVAALTNPAQAADLGGDCCADLEERIAELEATTARKGNRKVSLTIAGHVNKAVLYWDDGFEDNTYVVGNKNDQTNVSFTGEAEISKGWKAGYDITIRFLDTLSDAVDQNNANGDQGFFLWQSHWWIESEKLGKVSVGLASRVTDTAPETDFSEAGVAGYAGVQDIGGAFILRRADNSLAELAWGDVYNHFNGDTANIVRYDSPEIAGFIASASWGEDDVWDVGLRYATEGGGFKFEGVIAYTEVTDGTDEVIGNSNGLDQNTLVGSFSILHEPSGLNVTFAGGHREWQGTVIDADGIARTPEDTEYIYAKLGWLAKLNGLGPSAFYGEYGWFKDYVTAVLDGADIVDSLDVNDDAARIAGNEAEVWGFGVVQHIEAAEMQVYIGYRHHTVEFDLVDGAGAKVTAEPIEDFDTIIAGSKIAF
jgi:hypothetical protein